VEPVGLFEQGPVPGGVERDHLLAGRVQHGEPLVGQYGPARCLVAALHQVDGDVEAVGVDPEVHVLDLRVQSREHVQHRAEVVDLLGQRVLLDEMFSEN
jgi:hypothetical protein